MLRYTIAMSIRVLCIFACFLVPGWWMIIPAVGAIVLPYIAVVVANVSIASTRPAEVPQPRSIVLQRNKDDA